MKDVDLQPGAIANGAVELLNEVSASKITGEEERYSHTDLVDFEANVQGAQAAFDAVKPILEKKDPTSPPRSTAKFAAVTAALAPYRTGTTFVAYTALTDADTKALAQVIDALAEPLSQVGKQVVGGREPSSVPRNCRGRLRCRLARCDGGYLRPRPLALLLRTVRSIVPFHGIASGRDRDAAAVAVAVRVVRRAHRRPRRAGRRCSRSGRARRAA